MTAPIAAVPGANGPDPEAATVERTPRQRTVHIVWQTVSWLLLIAAFAMLCTTILVPKIAGARPYTVLTGSMRPDYPPGSLVVVKPQTVSSIHVGDVITYQIESGRADVVTHRVIEVDKGPDGQPTFITKGDNNNVADDNPVRPIQVRGVLWYSVPYLGFVNTWFTGAKRTTIIFIMAGLLFVYGAWQFYIDWRDGRREAETDNADEPRPDPDNTDTAPLRTEVDR